VPSAESSSTKIASAGEHPVETLDDERDVVALVKGRDDDAELDRHGGRVRRPFRVRGLRP
jgi:hypothetical protein